MTHDFLVVHPETPIPRTGTIRSPAPSDLRRNPDTPHRHAGGTPLHCAGTLAARALAVRSQARGNPDTPHRHHQIRQISARTGTIRSPDVQVVERELGFPVVVKTLRGTRGNGVLLCSSREQFHDLANLLDGAQAGADFIFQQYVSASHDRDVRVLVIDGRAVAAMQRQATDGSFKSNISLGGVGTAIEPPREMANLAIRVAAVLNLEVAGVDILFDDAGYRICEANSSPGFRT